MQGRSRIDIANRTAKSRALPSVRFDVLLLEGVAEWGPMNVATVVTDYPDFYEKYGDMLASYEMAVQAKMFFDGGGKRIIANRVCHITDHEAGSTPATAVKASKILQTAAGGLYGTTNTLTVTALYYGTLGNRLKVKVIAASNGEAARFDLLVYLDDQLVDGEWYRNLSMLDSDSNYVETVINTATSRSKYITVTDLDVGGAGGVAADQRPGNTATAQSLTGGDDGLTALADADFTGSATFNTGIHAFNLMTDGDMLAVPDKTTTAFQNAAIAWCETQKKGKVLFLTDPPAGSDKAAIVVQAQALTASESATGVLWPRIKISNPKKSVYGQGDTITICPSGSLAGRIAKNSETEKDKYFHQPGNEIYGLFDFGVGLETETVLEDTVRDWVTDYRVNPIMAGIRGVDGNYGVWLDDVQLLKTSGNYHSIGEGHGLCYLRKTFESYLQRHRTQNNTPSRRQDIKDAFDAELLKWTALEAFASEDADEAFYVFTDPEGQSLNNPTIQDEGRLRILVGVATSRPARFIELEFTRDNRAVESWFQQQLAANT